MRSILVPGFAALAALAAISITPASAQVSITHGGGNINVAKARSVRPTSPRPPSAASRRVMAWPSPTEATTATSLPAA